MTYKEAKSWLEQPGIMAMMPVDRHTQEALRVAKIALDKQSSRKVIRLFKNEFTKETWDSYCRILGVEDGDEIISLELDVTRVLSQIH